MKRRSCVTSTTVPVVVAKRQFELFDGLQVEMVRRLVEDEQVDAARLQLGEVGARPLARRERRAGPTDVIGAQAELREQRPRVFGTQSGAATESLEQGLRTVVRASALLERPDHGPPADEARARHERHVAEQHPEKRRFAAAVSPRDEHALAAPEEEVRPDRG